MAKAEKSAVKNIDLKMLAIISELNRTRSVSMTAENLEISQSAVSMSLAKLRRHFNDPLFVRTSSGMEPTPHATELIGLLHRAEGLLQTALGYHVVFDPKTSDRRFTISSTDIAQVTLLPKLMRRLRELAPGVRLDLRRISEQTPRQLETGEVDVAVGFIRPMGAGFCQQRLFKERFVCVMRRNHALTGDTLTIEEFENATHLAIATSGTGHGIVERTLEAKGIRRKVGLTVPSFLGIGNIITSLDYLAIVPEQLADYLTASGNLRAVPLPFHVPPYYIVQHWHERYTHDPASKWFRGVVAELFSASRPMAAAARLMRAAAEDHGQIHHSA